MKRLISVLAVLTCAIGLTACGGTEVNTISGTELPESSTALLIEDGMSVVETTILYAEAGYTTEDYEAELYSYAEYYAEYYESYYGTSYLAEAIYEDMGAEPYIEALEEYNSNIEDIGTFTGLYDNTQAVLDEDGYYVVNIGIEGTEHSADIVVTFDADQSLQGFTVNVRYSFSELIGQAGMNTLLGMGTTFVVLILLMVVIYCFRFINVFQANQSKKAAQKREAEMASAPAPAPAAPAAEEAAAQEEEETDDGELAAVIAAAVAAYEEEAGTPVSKDGFVVRSIRKSRRKY